MGATRIPRYACMAASLPACLYIAALLGFLVGAALVELFSVSSFEGGSGYLAILVAVALTPLLTGLLAFINYRRATDWRRALGLFVAETATAGILFAITGFI